MCATAIFKSTVAIVACACVGLFVLTVCAPAQTPADTVPPQNEVTVLPASEQEADRGFVLRVEGYVITGKIAAPGQASTSSSDGDQSADNDLSKLIGLSAFGISALSESEQQTADNDQNSNLGVIRVGPGLYRLIEKEPEGVTAYLGGGVLRGFEFSANEESEENAAPQLDPLDIAIFSFYIGLAR